jgi:hypothetical protein
MGTIYNSALESRIWSELRTAMTQDLRTADILDGKFFILKLLLISRLTAILDWRP